MNVSWARMKYIPWMGFVATCTTMGTCYVLARKHDHLPSWLIFPQPALLGARNPERTVYMVGFLLVSALFYCAALPFGRFLMSRVEQGARTVAKGVFFSSCIALLGLATHAVVPIQSNLADLIENGEDMTGDNLTLASTIHQAASSVFFVASWCHMALLLYLYRSSQRLASFVSKRWWALKAALLLAPGVTLLVALLYSPSDDSDNHGVYNVRGLSQWIMTWSVVLFYTSLSKDFSVIEKATWTDVNVMAGGSDLENAIELQVTARSLVNHQAPSAADAVDDDPLMDAPETQGLLS